MPVSSPPIKTLSKFFIVLAMGAIGLNTDIVKLVKTGGAPLPWAPALLDWDHRNQPADAKHVLGLW